MKKGNRRLCLYDQVLVLEDFYFKNFTGMVVRAKPGEILNGNEEIIVAIGDEEDILLGLGVRRKFQRADLKFLRKNLKKKFLRAKKKCSFYNEDL